LESKLWQPKFPLVPDFPSYMIDGATVTASFTD